MTDKIDFSIATSDQIEAALCQQIEAIRLTRNLTQAGLAKKAGVSRMTITRLENGQGSSLDTFIRVLMALGLHNHLQALLPDPAVRPVERVETGGVERKRARPTHPKDSPGSAWVWGDEKVGEK